MTFSSSNKQRGSVLTPRGKPLFDDANRFGTRMLEKMGWSKGKGLGANLDGEQNFIRVTHKSNQCGFGFADRNDQWTQHEIDFNVLLKSLNNNNTTDTNGDSGAKTIKSLVATPLLFLTTPNTVNNKEKKLEDISSLEQISKNSRSRVHYQKFIKGKDLSKYNAKELANIFGKKSLTDDEDTNKNSKDIINNNNTPEIKKTIPNFGITTIETGTSINDYFRKKRNVLNANEQQQHMNNNNNVQHSMEKIKEKNHSMVTDTESSKKLIDIPHDDDDDPVDESSSSIKQSNKRIHEEDEFDQKGDDILNDSIQKKRKKKKKEKEHSIEKNKSMKETNSIQSECVDGNLEEVEPNFNVMVEKSKKKKKEKKSKRENHQMENNESCDPTTNDQINAAVDESEANIDGNKEGKKKKKRKIYNNNENIPSDGEIIKSNKSKRKNVSEDDSTTIEYNGIVDNDGDGVTVDQHSLIKNIITDLNSGIIITRDIQFSDHDDDDDTDDKSQVEVNQLKETFELDRYKAEVFRFFDMDAFRSSTISKISGYGYSDKIQLKINTTGRDSEKINTLWDKALMNKYGKDVIQTKKKQKYSIKALKKKSVFMTI